MPSNLCTYCTPLAGFFKGRHVALDSVQYTHSTEVTKEVVYWTLILDHQVPPQAVVGARLSANRFLVSISGDSISAQDILIFFGLWTRYRTIAKQLTIAWVVPLVQHNCFYMFLNINIQIISAAKWYFCEVIM